jgi:hypothetical protein
MTYVARRMLRAGTFWSSNGPRLLTVTLVIALLTACGTSGVRPPVATSDDDTPQISDSGAATFLEAENATPSEALTIGADDLASAGLYLTYTMADVMTSPETETASLGFVVTDAVEYTLWARVRGAGSGSDVVRLGFDGEVTSVIVHEHQEWTWLVAARRTLSVGEHRVSLGSGEPGTQFDVFAIVTDDRIQDAALEAEVLAKIRTSPPARGGPKAPVPDPAPQPSPDPVQDPPPAPGPAPDQDTDADPGQELQPDPAPSPEPEPAPTPPSAPEPVPPPSPAPPPAPEPSPSPARLEMSLLGDPRFSASQLTSEQQVWFSRLWAAIGSPSQEVDKWAASGDLYHYGRSLNLHVHQLLTAFRVTGDLRLLDEVDRISRIMEARLADRWLDGTRDGFRNWTWLYDKGSSHYGKDLHVMDDIMTHAGVAAMMATLHANRNLASPSGLNYGARADFWYQYLKNDFEAKWRARNKKATTFPFLETYLMHPVAQWARYHHYMGIVSGASGYRTEAARLAKIVAKQLVVTPTKSGEAYIWCHITTTCMFAQPTNYARYTVNAITDLVWEGVAPLSKADLERLATTVTVFVADNGTKDLAPDVAGGVTWNGFAPYSTVRQGIRRLEPLSVLAVYDRNASLHRTVRDAYGVIERSPNNPAGIAIPAALLLHASR